MASIISIPVAVTGKIAWPQRGNYMVFDFCFRAENIRDMSVLKSFQSAACQRNSFYFSVP
jgi:O-phosphoseryl-tRNA(Cys) synthetase